MTTDSGGRKPLHQPRFLPMTAREMRDLGWDALDVLLVSGDAYVDHPTFGIALLGRWLVAHGFRTGIVAQPDWKADNAYEALTVMGRPRLFVGVTAGALDSMLAHYTAFRKKRSDDAYTPGGQAGARPNRACLVFANLAKKAFPGLPLILGGIEASLRRVAHYDFWTDAVRKPIGLDAKADAVLYGMGERSILELARRLDKETENPFAILPGAATLDTADLIPADDEVIELPSHEDLTADPKLLMRATLDLERQVHQGKAYAVQACGKRTVVVAPPAEPLSTKELDALYELPFTRQAHPSYTAPIPAVNMIRDSVTSHRGCAGGCSFCALALHQGRILRSRSRASILAEVDRMAQIPGWKGSISDVGGPSANMWGGRCTGDHTKCKRSSCLVPRICPKFEVDQAANLELLRAVRKRPGVKHVRVASGVRMDLALTAPAVLRQHVAEFVGGQLKVAPEHFSDSVLKLMRKPSFERFEAFIDLFADQSRRAGKEQYIVPYLMSAFPGCTMGDMKKLAAWLENRGWSPQQVQCFIPLPGTVSAAMFAGGIGPDGEPIQVARTDAERLRQHGVLAPTGQKPGTTPRKPGRKPGHKAASGKPDGKPGRPGPKGSKPAPHGPRGSKKRSADRPGAKPRPHPNAKPARSGKPKKSS